MKHAVSTLEGPLLDAAVAKAKGLPFRVERIGHAIDRNQRERCVIEGMEATFAPSTEWAVGGPIIEREWATIRNELERQGGVAWARSILLVSPNTLRTFMRAYVAAKFGDEVDL